MQLEEVAGDNFVLLFKCLKRSRSTFARIARPVPNIRFKKQFYDTLWGSRFAIIIMIVVFVVAEYEIVITVL